MREIDIRETRYISEVKYHKTLQIEVTNVKLAWDQIHDEQFRISIKQDNRYAYLKRITNNFNGISVSSGTLVTAIQRQFIWPMYLQGC